MSFISAINLSYQAGAKALFEGLSFSLQAGDRIGLVGHNGSGKSTLLNLLVGRLTPDHGQLHVQRGLSIGLVEQFLPEHLAGLTAEQAVLKQLPESERSLRGYQVATLLTGLGFDATLQQQPLQALSGGQKNLVLLACAQIQQPELLLLDEPGNHMDNRALAYLKRFLQSVEAPAFLMISHDRDLLDSVTTRTFWLRDQRCYCFGLPYSRARQALAEQDAAARQARQAEEKHIDKLKSSAKRLATWGQVYDNEDLARKAKSMTKRIDKLEAQKTFVSQGSGLSLSVDAALLQARQLLTIESAAITTVAGRLLFSAEFFTLRPGDRIALLGLNGTGKSTFIDQLIRTAGQAPDAKGALRFNPNVRIGYFDQELAELTTSDTIFDWLRAHSQAADDEIRQTLIQWGFPYLEHTRRVSVLSGGERARILLLSFQLDQPNLLIMDEPTNHIDLQGKESLEEQLLNNPVSLLFTSHDQRFIETVATRFWWIHDGALVELADPKPYLASLGGDCLAMTQAESHRLLGIAPAVPAGVEDNEEQLLAQIIELERLLADDLARKARFQKPQRQAQWRADIARLYALLDN